MSSDTYDRLEDVSRAVRRNEEELEDNRRQLAAVEEKTGFLQHAYREQREVFEAVSIRWKGSGALRFLQRGSERNEEAIREARRSVEQEHEKLEEERRRLRRAGEDLEQEYYRVKRRQ